MTGEILASLKVEVKEAIEAFRRELSRVRTGRAAPSLLDGIQVEYYGTKTPLNQIATINAADARLLVVTPFDKTALNAIDRAIRTSDLGLNPVNDGKILRLPIPELNEERRKEFVRHVRKTAEDYRVSLRGHRRDANEMIKELLKDKDIAEDESRTAQEKIQIATDDGITSIDGLLKSKEAEIMQV